MLLNIVTGNRAPVVPKLPKEEIIIIQATIEKLSRCGRFFFTDGQANGAHSGHFNNLDDLNKLDWKSIQTSNFNKSDGDFDRLRRYQAEFLVHTFVPLSAIDSIVVYSENTANFVRALIDASGKELNVLVIPEYFF